MSGNEPGEGNRNPYPWTNLEDIVDKPIPQAIREELSRTPSEVIQKDLAPRRPMPVLMGFPFTMTRPHPEKPGGIIMSVMTIRPIHTPTGCLPIIGS